MALQWARKSLARRKGRAIVAPLKGLNMTMTQRIFTVSDHHVAAPEGRRPPQINGDDPNTYHSYFENACGEQSLFVYRRETKKATLYCGDAGWVAFPVVDGRVVGLVLSPAEELWVQACWQASRL